MTAMKTQFPNLKETWIKNSILGVCGILTLIQLFIAEGMMNIGDGAAHYLIAKNAFKHPELFFNHWGKPLFTLLSASFAQFGPKGMVVFNLLMAMLTLEIAYRILLIFQVRQAYFVLPIIFFSPSFFEMVLSGMTEITFAVFLLLSIYQCLKSNFLYCSLLVSLMPFIRPEAYIIVPLFVLTFCTLKQWKYLPWFGFGLVVYSLLGSLIIDDLFWFFNNEPYSKARNIYGNGSVFHFVNNTKNHIGIIGAIIFVLGSIYTLVLLIQDKYIKNKKTVFLFLTAGSFLCSLIVHSFLWWKGDKGSLGLTRVLTTSTPAALIIGFYGIKTFLDNRSKPIFVTILFLLISFEGIRASHALLNLPIKNSTEGALLVEAAKWLKSQEIENNKVGLLSSYFAIYADIDIYNTEKCIKLWSISKDEPHLKFKQGDWIVWDAHFSPNEGKLPLEAIENSPYFERVKSFYPDKPLKTLNNLDYSIHLFRVIDK